MLGIGPYWKEGWNHPRGREISKDIAIWHKEFLSEIPLIFLPLEFHPLIWFPFKNFSTSLLQPPTNSGPIQIPSLKGLCVKAHSQCTRVVFLWQRTPEMRPKVPMKKMPPSIPGPLNKGKHSWVLPPFLVLSPGPQTAPLTLHFPCVICWPNLDGNSCSKEGP